MTFGVKRRLYLYINTHFHRISYGRIAAECGKLGLSKPQFVRNCINDYFKKQYGEDILNGDISTVQFNHAKEKVKENEPPKGPPGLAEKYRPR